ncbi:Heat shock protein 90, partial [Spraguea lophii 42_110]
MTEVKNTTQQENVHNDNINTEKHKYDVEVESLMSTIINSVYSAKDYFLRELISNCSDANDKLVALYNEYKQKGCKLHLPSELRIDIIPNEVNNTLVIKDNGVGMTKSDMINFLGTISSSGTKKFKEAYKKEGGDKNVDQLIGQFGLGFYSAFLIADKVEVISKHPLDSQHRWVSTGLGDYTIEEMEGTELHGTTIILHVKEGDKEFLRESKLKKLVKKYSSFVAYPIYLHVEKEKEEEVEEKKEETKVTEEKETDEPVVEEIKEKKKIKVTEVEHINKEKPLWNRKPSDCTTEEYSSFYKAISNDWEDYLAVKHSKLEGLINFDVLIFCPKRAPNKMFEKVHSGIKLYNKNVLVTDNIEELPEWCNFVQGVIASNDLPVNISREILQGKNTMKLIKKTILRKVTEMMDDISKDDAKFEIFYKEFSSNLKLGIRDDDVNREKMMKVLRYYSTKSNDKMISLDEYKKNMVENQKQIYILTGSSKDEVFNSPFLAGFKDYEILFMYEVMDEIMLQNVKTYDGLEFQRINAEGIELPVENKVDEKKVKENEAFMNKIKEILDSKVEKVVSAKVNMDSPCVICTTKYSHSSAMENIIRSQPGAENNPFMQMMGLSKKIVELNLDHPVVKKMKVMVENEDKDLNEYIHMIYNTALIECGYRLDDSAAYA